MATVTVERTSSIETIRAIVELLEDAQRNLEAACELTRVLSGDDLDRLGYDVDCRAGVLRGDLVDVVGKQEIQTHSERLSVQMLVCEAEDLAELIALGARNRESGRSWHPEPQAQRG